MDHVATEALIAALPEVRESPRGAGRVELIVRRPSEDARKIVAQASLDPEQGLVGDRWYRADRELLPDGSVDRATQLTLMNSRFAALIAGLPERWALAGDQLYLDLDLSVEHLPPGTRLAVGAAVIEMSEQPHTGCAKFSARFGSDAWRLANSPEGRALRLRGANAWVVTGGLVRVGDAVLRLDGAT